MQQNNNSKKVSFTVFTWVIGIIIIIVGWLFAYINGVSGRVDNFTNNFNTDIVKIQVQLSQIQTDILWIKDRLE